jgi:hypothetical protein
VNSDAAVAGMEIGGSAGKQSVVLAAPKITLNGALQIHANGELRLESGTVYGVGTLSGMMNWHAGYFRDCTLTVQADGVLRLSTAGTKALLHSTLNNEGTIQWTDAGSFGAISTGNQSDTVITNQPGGVFDIQTDAAFFYDSSGGFHFPFVLHNAGTLRKSAGSGTNVFIDRLIFGNYGQVALDQGAFSFQCGFTNNGTFTLANGSTAILGRAADTTLPTYGFGPASQTTGAGKLLVAGGTIQLLGTAPSFEWTAGTLESSSFTIATNATCVLSGSGTKGLRDTVMQNAGRVLWTGTGAISAISAGSSSQVNITNLAGGEFEIATDADLYWDSQGGFYFHVLIHNAGLLRKTAGSGETKIPATEGASEWINFVNTGTISVEQGTLVFPIFDNEGELLIQNGTAQFPTTFYNNGALTLASNMVINLAGSKLSFGPNSQIDGDGQLAIPSGDVTLNGTVRNLLWTGGRLLNSTLTIATNGTLIMDGADEKRMSFSTLINAGTVRWSGSGNFRAKSEGTNTTVLITNLPGAVFDLQTDGDLIYDHSGGFQFLCMFDNQGTLRKSGGTGESVFSDQFQFNNTGLIEIRTGTLKVTDSSAQIRGKVTFFFSNTNVFGKLNIPSKAYIRSVIHATLASPSSLNAGDEFPVLQGGAGLPHRVVFSGRNLGNGWVYDPVAGSAGVTLKLRSATHPAPPVLSLSYVPELPTFVLMEGGIGMRYQLDSSAGLDGWISLGTGSATNGVWEFEDSKAPALEHKFYRGKEVEP